MGNLLEDVGAGVGGVLGGMANGAAQLTGTLVGNLMGSPPQHPQPSRTPHATEASGPDVYRVTLIYERERGQPLSPSKEITLDVTERLAHTMARASSVKPNDDVALSFTSLLNAMILSPDGWLRGHLQSQGADLAEIQSQSRGVELAHVLVIDAPTVPPSTPPKYLTSESARRALEEALTIARKLGKAPLDERHLVASYPALDTWHEDDFKAFKIDRLEWCRAWGAACAKQYPAEKWYWQGYANRAAPVPLVSFSPDVYTSNDLLDIDRGVDALALLVASTRTVTPLALGIFGPWGSGKSFFMRHLRKRIHAQRDKEKPRIEAWTRTRVREDRPLYFPNIAQVEFNAWHYNEGNLLASLVGHMFSNLRVSPDEDKAEIEQRQTALLAQIADLELNDARGAAVLDEAKTLLQVAKARVDEANLAVDAARQDIDTKTAEIELLQDRIARERAELERQLRAARSGSQELALQDIVAVALAPFATLDAEMSRTVNDARVAVFDWRAFVSRVASVRGMVVIVLLLAAPTLAWLADLATREWAALGAVITTALGAFGNALEVLREQRKRFEAKAEELSQQQARRGAELEKMLEAKRDALLAREAEAAEQRASERAKQLEVLSQREAAAADNARALAERAKNLDATLEQRHAEEAKLREAKQTLAQLSSALLLENFIRDRASTDEYKKELGFLALVRRDIEKLSSLIENANRAWLDEAQAGEAPTLNRIVLYIDDLDRCKESTVVSVLEAVHLLLAFPLFVCAVAVDPRWVERCLRAKHVQLFTDEPAQQSDTPPATVADYLEKIFQIPIWMSSIDERTRASLVNALLGSSALTSVVSSAETTHEHTALVRSHDTAQSNGFEVQLAKKRERPDPLQISEHEAEFVREVAPLLSDRPRALKRFVNVYRLLKASLPDIEAEHFVTADRVSPHRICISQLALFTSEPRLAPVLLQEIAAAQQGSLSLSEWFRLLSDATRQLLGSAFARIPDCDVVTVDQFRAWLPSTSRYLFNRAH